MSEDSEKKCLLTPGTNTDSLGNFAFSQNEPEQEELRSPEPQETRRSIGSMQQMGNSNLIYSEPTLAGPCPTLVSFAPLFAISDTALPQIYANHKCDSGISSSTAVNEEDNDDDDQDQNNAQNTPRSSMYMSDMSFCTSIAGGRTHKPSFSTREIREQHDRMQEKYRVETKRERRFTDPVDFEGILNIIGGCSWWQIWIYVLIAMQQIPHAMFNLNVVYMMYDPRHRCQVPGFDSEANDTTGFLWDIDDVANVSLVFPPVSGEGTARYERDSSGEIGLAIQHKNEMGTNENDDDMKTTQISTQTAVMKHENDPKCGRSAMKQMGQSHSAGGFNVCL